MKIQFKPLYWLFYLLSLLPYSLQKALASFLTVLAWLGKTRMREVTELNLAYCYPEKSSEELVKMAKASMLATAKTAIEAPQVWLQPADKSIAKFTNVKGKDIIDNAQADGQGILLLAPHIGNWEYLGAYLSANYDMMAMYKPAENPVIDELIITGRKMMGCKLAPTNRKGILAFVKHLKSGSMAGILPDQAPDDPNSRVSANFFGKPAPTMTLVGSLLKKANAKAVVAGAIRQDNGQFEIIFKEVDNSIYSEDAVQSAKALNMAVESIVKEAPEQYQWEYKRFKYDEDGKKHPLYKKQLL